MGKQFDGITVDGKSIESYLLDESDKEVGEVIQRERKVYPKKKGSKVKYMETKEKNGQVKTTPQSELNKLNLTANLSKANTRVEKIIAYLLTGESFTSKEVAEDIDITQESAADVLRNMYKSNLGHYLIRSGHPRRGYVFRMQEMALNFTPEQAHDVYKSKEKVEPKKVKQRLTEYKVPEPPELVRAPLDINLNISGGIQITFAFKLER